MRFTNHFYHIASGGQAYIYKVDIKRIKDMSYRLENMQYYLIREKCWVTTLALDNR